MGNSPGGDRLDPVGPRQRIELLDILRGWALFGVFLCNTRWFSGAWEPATLWTGPANRLATRGHHPANRRWRELLGPARK